MRQLGIQGTRHGKHLVPTRSLKGTGGRHDYVNHPFTVKAPHQVHGTDIDVRETGSWCFTYTAFDTVVWGGLYLLA